MTHKPPAGGRVKLGPTLGAGLRGGDRGAGRRRKEVRPQGGPGRLRTISSLDPGRETGGAAAGGERGLVPRAGGQQGQPLNLGTPTQNGEAGVCAHW